MNDLNVAHNNTENIEVIDQRTIVQQCIDSVQCLSENRENRILIIEDNRTLAEVMAMIFEEFGNVEIADNGSIGLNKISKTYFDVIISDIEMPIMNGIDFFYNALKFYPNIRERIVFCSGSSKEAHQHFIQKHCLRYLSKPFDTEEIRGIVYQIISETSR